MNFGFFYSFDSSNEFDRGGDDDDRERRGGGREWRRRGVILAFFSYNVAFHNFS